MRYIDSPLQKRSKHQAELAMVFSSLPPYHLDSSNWHHQHIIGSSNSPQAPVPPPPQQPHGGSNNIRAGSMSERARQANIPMPEPAQRCPRCDSTNTKFCYFNNYSLTQPRHFCKTCRRYWTRGGALRTVPVGGGCRRNKRTSSSSSSKATSSSSSGSKSSPAPQSTTNNNNNNNIINNLPYGLSSLGPHFQPMLMSQLSEGFTGEMMMNLNTYNNNNNINNINNNNIPSSSDYHASSNSFLGFEQWKMQQFPFLGGLDLSLPGVYNEFQGDGQKMTSSLGQMGSTVKMEESKNPAGQLSLMSRDQWSRDINMNGNGGGSASAAANNWTHQLSSFASPSTSNHLQ